MQVILLMPNLINYIFNMIKGCSRFLEILKVSPKELLFDKLKCVSKPRNANIDHLPFDCDQRLITSR